MKRHWIEYTQEWAQGPMTYWVHVPSCAEPCQLTPPPPAGVPGKGYPVYYVEVDGFTFQFASLDELRVCIDVLGKKLLPNTLRLPNRLSAKASPRWRWAPRGAVPWP